MRSLEALGMPVASVIGSAAWRASGKKAGPAALYKNLTQVCILNVKHWCWYTYRTLFIGNTKHLSPSLVTFALTV